MIIGEQKPIQEIISSLGDREGIRILVVGCDSCMTVSLAGGKEEVRDLVHDLSAHSRREKLGWSIKGLTLKRQCEKKFTKEIAADVRNSDAVVSLGCGVGAQSMSETFPERRIIPGINTSNMGAPEKKGVFKEKCMGCGKCTIDTTAGICTLARCAKGLQNGPCGGSVNGKCELYPETDCAWYQVYTILEGRGELPEIPEPVPPKDWSRSHSGGVRTVKSKE
ncbi:MAG: hypothetical protein GX137_04455 [Thermoplasmatales archaeon]|jgi:hypothetical protein|nr:hypothetical protein [Thermoplasmatales archaeon]